MSQGSFYNLIKFDFRLINIEKFIRLTFCLIILQAEPLSQHLFNLEPRRWRPLRTKLSPIFTSRKLKEMFSLMSECADHLVDYTEKLVSRNEPVECQELMAKYATDVIGSCAFGIEMNALSNEDSEFRRIGRDVFRQPWSDHLRAKIKVFSPWLYDILGYILPDTEITSFFMRLVVDSMDYREKNNIVRNDFIDTLRELKKHSDKMGDISEYCLLSLLLCYVVRGFFFQMENYPIKRTVASMLVGVCWDMSSRI